MMKKIISLFIFLPFAALTKAPDSQSWPHNMAEAWMKNTGIVDITKLDEAKTDVKRLAPEKKQRPLHPGLSLCLSR
ncbi:hypothetical protein [Erwinia psidii]|uniref:hypothetical protein n=1 Tax=Erwinia psidii TaxID=69224 RepID=UPI001F3C6AE9|nr:hypothetical protein [Erwinia psidii]